MWDLEENKVEETSRALNEFMASLLPFTERPLALGDKLKPIDHIKTTDCAVLKGMGHVTRQIMLT